MDNNLKILKRLLITIIVVPIIVVVLWYAWLLYEGSKTDKYTKFSEDIKIELMDAVNIKESNSFNPIYLDFVNPYGREFYSYYDFKFEISKDEYDNNNLSYGTEDNFETLSYGTHREEKDKNTYLCHLKITKSFNNETYNKLETVYNRIHSISVNTTSYENVLNNTVNNDVTSDRKNIENSKLKTTNGCKYKHFKPSFNENGYGPDTYDFTQDMEYKDKFYHKIISNYDEYMIYKNRWNDICDMDEQDFENNFMIITAIENTSMLGLDIYEIHKDENILYIDFDVSKENYDNNETCNSIIIPNSLKCDIVEVRDLRKIDETPEYIYGWKNESTEGMEMIPEDTAVKIAKEYAKNLPNSDSLLGQWLEKYTKVHDVSLTKKRPNNYWLLKKDDTEKHLVASYERTVYEVVLVPYDDEVEIERAHFYVDAYTGKVIGGMQTGD